MSGNIPFLLKPAAKDYLWGGRRLNDEFNKGIDVYPLAETWECSTHPDGQSLHYRFLLNFLKQLHSEGNTIVMITHDNAIALEAKRVVRIHDGKIIFDGDTEEYAAKFQTSH